MDDASGALWYRRRCGAVYRMYGGMDVECGPPAKADASTGGEGGKHGMGGQMLGGLGCPRFISFRGVSISRLSLN